MEGWRKFYNEKHYNCYCQPGATQCEHREEDEMGGTCSMY